MKKMLFIAIVVVSCFSAAFAQGDSSMKMKEKSLYERVGGYDALAAVSDDFIVRLATSKKLGRFVVGLSDDSKKKLRQHLVEFLCHATGGSCEYTGRDMKTSHKGLGITEADWDESVKLLNETFDKFKVPERERTELLAAVGSLKKDIVDMK